MFLKVGERYSQTNFCILFAYLRKMQLCFENGGSADYQLANSGRPRDLVFKGFEGIQDEGNVYMVKYTSMTVYKFFPFLKFGVFKN